LRKTQEPEVWEWVSRVEWVQEDCGFKDKGKQEVG
jgi:hypothetical protein